MHIYQLILCFESMLHESADIIEFLVPLIGCFIFEVFVGTIVFMYILHFLP